MSEVKARDAIEAEGRNGRSEANGLREQWREENSSVHLISSPSPKRIILLGATGSIGLNAADVVRAHPDAFEVVAVAALRSKEKCEALAKEFGARAYVGEDAALKAVEENDADVCLVATVGMSGLKPTVAAIEKGMDIALATKEVMVMAGEFVTALARKHGVRFLPVDSEHSAIFQCLAGEKVRGAIEAEGRNSRSEAKGLREQWNWKPLNP